MNTLMKNVCPLEPVLDSPLGYRFGFKAFMFQGMKSGDDVVMNVKLSGCIFKQDCQLVRSGLLLGTINSYLEARAPTRHQFILS